MKEVPLEEWAKRLLEDQIARLGELRNANPRDPGFKLWRQTTLTVIQRVWPGNLPKSEAFRRIPFSTPNTKATRAQVREHYERGCAEAIAHLNGLMLEIDDGGLKPADAPAHLEPQPMPSIPAPVLSRPTDEPKNLEILDEGLVGTGPLSKDQLDARGDATLPPQFVSPVFDHEPDLEAPSVSPPTRFTSPQFGDEPSIQSAHATPAAPRDEATPTEPRVRREPTRPAPPPPPPASSGPEPPPTAGAPVHPASGRVPRSGRRALKDMLGFGDESRSSAAEDSTAPEPETEEPLAPARPAPAFGIPSFLQRSTPAPTPAPTPPPELVESDQDAEPEDDRALAVDPPVLSADEVEPDPFARDEGDEEADVTLDLEPDEEEVAEEFLRTSPVLSAQPRPLSAPRHTRSVPGAETPTAAALTSLASDITRLGIPEGHRAATRAALLGLARQFDDRTVTWLSIRQAIALVLEYPALARRVIPLLVPYLELE